MKILTDFKTVLLSFIGGAIVLIIFEKHDIDMGIYFLCGAFGLYIIFVLVFRLYDRTKEKKSANRKIKSIFEELDLDTLEEWGKYWTEPYENFIHRIVLYRYPPLSDKTYCLYFEFDVFSEAGSRMKNYFNSYQWEEEHYPVKKRDIEKFKNVYKNLPKNSAYINEWDFELKKPSNAADLNSLVIYTKPDLSRSSLVL